MLKSGENGLIGSGSNDYGRAQEGSVQEQIIVPTICRIVVYTSVSLLPHIVPTTKCPAIVQDEYDMYPGLSVLTGIANEPIRFVSSVPHKSVAVKNEAGEIIQPYWEWPERK